MTTKWCRYCEQNLDLNEFRVLADGSLTRKCRSCDRAYQHKVRQRLTFARLKREFGLPNHQVCDSCGLTKKIERFKVLSNKTGKIRTTCKKCWKAKPRLPSGRLIQPPEYRRKKAKAYYERNKTKIREQTKAGIKRIRMRVLTHYSGGSIPACACCGEARYEFLAIDHIEGNGNEHRRSIGGGGHTFLFWLIKNNFPEGFRVLCHNCNGARGSYGYCPHEREDKQDQKT